MSQVETTQRWKYSAENKLKWITGNCRLTVEAFGWGWAIWICKFCMKAKTELHRFLFTNLCSSCRSLTSCPLTWACRGSLRWGWSWRGRWARWRTGTRRAWRWGSRPRASRWPWRGWGRWGRAAAWCRRGWAARPPTTAAGTGPPGSPAGAGGGKDVIDW